MDYVSRQSRMQQAVHGCKLGGFVVTHPANLRYLCAYTGSNGLLLFLGKRRIFYTDGRYQQQAHEEVRGARIVIARRGLLEETGELLNKERPATLGFEPEHTSTASYFAMRKLTGKRITWKPAEGLIQRQRMIKDSDELKLIREAVQLGAKCYEQVLPHLQAGMQESTFAAQLEFAARAGGADGMSFETIVAAGPRSALPHGRATGEPVPKRGFVVIDSGVVLHGYCSDMTRTVHAGRISAEHRRWYDSVLEAQKAGIAAVKPGAIAQDVDEAARAVLREAGLDKYFTHSTGHGVGLEIHEPPRLGKNQEETLAPGMVVTIEPGIYVPGEGGIRIEDMVLVTETGAEILTPVSKELVVI